MVSFKSKLLGKRTIAVFGVAMSTSFVVPELQADILEISWNGGQSRVDFSPDVYSSIAAQLVDVDQIGNFTIFSTDFSVFYTLFTLLSSKNGYTYQLHEGNFEVANKTIVGVRSVRQGEQISPSTFVALEDGLQARSGSRFAAFQTTSGNVGWFKISFFEGVGYSFQEGEFADAGETLTVGGELKGDINCDGFVNLMDIAPMVDLIANVQYSSKGDFDNNGIVNLLDVGPFIDELLN